MGKRLVLNLHKPVIGMLHVPALPGSPQNALPFRRIVEWVIHDADALVRGGIDALILENFGDTPFFPGRVPTHTATFLTTLGCAVRSNFESVPLGINVLRNDGVAAVAVAAASMSDFIRVNVHTAARLTDQGIIEGAAHKTLRYRKTLGWEGKVFADVQVKHSAAIAVRTLAEEVEETVSRGGADAIVITGSATGKATPLDDLNTARSAAHAAPVIAGSGVDLKSIAEILKAADGVIVGTSLKKDGVTSNPVDPARVKDFMKAVRRFR